jgi:hypothetical protein
MGGSREDWSNGLQGYVELSVDCLLTDRLLHNASIRCTSMVEAKSICPVGRAVPCNGELEIHVLCVSAKGHKGCGIRN